MSLELEKLSLPGGIRLVQATDEDFGIVHGLHGRAMRPSLELAMGGWDADGQEAWLRRHWAMGPTWLFKHNDTVVGSVSCWVKDGGVYVDLLQLDEGFRNRGIGSAFLLALAEQAKKNGLDLTLSVLERSDAVRFYRRLGFKEESADGVLVHLRRPIVRRDGGTRGGPLR